MSKKVISAVLAVIMLFACALPAFAAHMSESEAKNVVSDRVWLQDENTTYAFENTEDEMIVTVVNHGVTFVFHLNNIVEKPKLVGYSVGDDMDSFTFVAMFNAVVLRLASLF